jgi:hypothetical protein
MLETGQKSEIELMFGHWTNEEEDILQVLIMLFGPD